MRVYSDRDADLSLLHGRRIAAIGYGNQGRAQALNLRDSGLEVIVGNRQDEFAARAREDGFSVVSIPRAATDGDIVLLLIPDEVMPEVFEKEVAPHLEEGNVLVFASGYTVAFDCITLPPIVDVVLVAPRMIGAGVRELYGAGRGFPSFIGVAQDHSGRAREIALALAKGIGSTRAGVVEVSFAQEAELDLFTEQCFGPAIGNVLTSAVDLLLEEGYPPEAVLLELYMSGELSYTFGKIAQVGTIEQSALHSRTSQYGSMSRGIRFRTPELRQRMCQGLEEIRSGAFAREWASEQAEGCPTLEVLREQARSLPLHQMEQELLAALHDKPAPRLVGALGEAPAQAAGARRKGFRARMMGWLGRLGSEPEAEPLTPLEDDQLEEVLRSFVAQAAEDLALQEFSRGRRVTTRYVLSDRDLQFYLSFLDGAVSGGLGSQSGPAEVQLTMNTETLDGMFTGRINAARAAMSGSISYDGDIRLAMGVQRVQKDLIRLYRLAREEVISRRLGGRSGAAWR